MYRALRLSLLPLLLMLAGCSGIRPQQVQLQPQVDVRQRLPSGLRVELDARDLRKSPIIGYRVSRFEQNAFITLARDARYTLLSSAQRALREMGVYRFGPLSGAPRDLKMTLLLDQLSYDASQSTTRQQVRLQMKLRMVTEMNRHSFTGQYQAQQEYDSTLAPSEAKNQELINALAGQTLGLAFNDPRLLKFIRQQAR